jgi:tetratricopeptide (TPR) repeat protein
MDGPALLAGQTGDALRIETGLYALGAGGGVQASLLEPVEIDLAAQRSAVERSGVDYLGSLALKPGTYSLRLLARNVTTGRLGVRTFPLVVPDLGGLPTPSLSSPPAADPRPTARARGLGPLDPPLFPNDDAGPRQAAAPPPVAAPPPAAPPLAPVPETAEGRRLRSVARAAYREALARLAAGGDAEALAAVAALEDSLLGRADRPASVDQLVEIEAGAAGELAAVDPESLVPLLRLHQRLYDDATVKRRLQGSTVAREVVFRLTDLYRGRGPELARRVTATFGVELVRSGIRGMGGQMLRRALADDPGDEIALLELAVDAERRGDRAEAAGRLEALLRVHPDNPEARLRLALDQARLGRTAEARQALSALIRQETGGWRLSLACQELARLLMAAGDPAGAERTLREGLERLPGDEKLTLLLAAYLERTGGAAAAREALAGLKPETGEGGGAARHRYNLPPEEPLATALAGLDREAESRRAALATALERTGP